MIATRIAAIWTVATLLLLLTVAPVCADPPEVVSLMPENDADNVDPETDQLRIVFDRDMNRRGFSICGGGPDFPDIRGRPRWIDDRTLVARVKLEPDHDYEMSINCPAATNFRSKEGVPAKPLLWSFRTAPAGQTDDHKPEGQKEANAKSLDALMKALRKHYSYYELRGIDWEALREKHQEKIEGARNTRNWIRRAASMLRPAEDTHLRFFYEDEMTPTHRRWTTPNVTQEGLKAALPNLRQVNDAVQTALTADNVGYISITTLGRDATADLAEVQNLLQEYRDADALILDLRLNGGGSEPLAEPIAAWFVRGTKTYAKHVYRQPDAPGGFSPVQNRTLTGNRPPKRFDKPVAVLIGPVVLSSAEAFVLMLKQAPKVTVIGAATGGSSGNPQPHELPNGVMVYIPSWKAMLPDGTCFEGQGIKPDIEVEVDADDLRYGDPVLRRAIEHLRKTNANGGNYGTG